ncbi:Fe-S cluster assembly ATPase SufC [Candidatus Micrarchaeota archaeon CG1_02_55_22]|nr:MAG: Fe-S cluster assembly ATPase SufC [Candidatus Micrarchaeota archaeon CG1_02_55_22]
MIKELAIKGLHASVAGKSILKGVDLVVRRGEIHALMGPNGSGKSTLSSVIMGNPGYTVDEGDILADGKSILSLEPEERAKLGLFLSFQYPLEVPGVTVSNFLRTAYGHLHEPISPVKFAGLLKKELSALHMKADVADRYLNDGFSGGEKKRAEMLQMALLKPSIAILDETDSGLDVDALKIVSESANRLAKESGTGILLITHYQRILKYVKPDRVHVFVNGRIVNSGGPELAEKLESRGYAEYSSKLGLVE